MVYALCAFHLNIFSVLFSSSYANYRIFSKRIRGEQRERKLKCRKSLSYLKFVWSRKNSVYFHLLHEAVCGVGVHHHQFSSDPQHRLIMFTFQIYQMQCLAFRALCASLSGMENLTFDRDNRHDALKNI